MTNDALLRVEAINIDGSRKRFSVAVQICDRTSEILLDYLFGDAVSWITVPVELQRQDAARRRMIEVTLDVFHGRPVELPVDLSAIVRDSFSPWPAPFGDIKHTEPRGDFVLTRTERREPGIFAVYFNFDRIPSEVMVDIREPATPTLFRFVRGVHPWQLDHDERHTLLQGLAGAVREAAGLEGTVVV